MRWPVRLALLAGSVATGGCFLVHGAADSHPEPDAGWVVPADPGPCTPGQPCDCAAVDPVPSGTHIVGLDGPYTCVLDVDPYCDPYTGGPAHEVRLTRDLWLGRYEVTSGCFARCARQGGCDPDEVVFVACDTCTPPERMAAGYWRQPDNATLPAVDLTYAGASQYCAWLGGRLPTNAEWEKAARGEHGKRWPWAPDPDDPWRATIDELNQLAAGWTPGSDIPAYIPPGIEDGLWGATPVVPVGSFPEGRGPYGHHDLVGNAEEWVSDWFALYSGLPQTDPTGPPEPDPDWPGAHTVRGEGYWLWERSRQQSRPFTDRRIYTWGPTRDRPHGARCAFDVEPSPLPMWETAAPP